MNIGGLVTIVEGLFPYRENVIQWRGAVDPRTKSLVEQGGTGCVQLRDEEGNRVTSAPAVFRSPGWYEARLPENAGLEPGKKYTIDFELTSPSGIVGRFSCRSKALPPASEGPHARQDRRS